jgi:hypothetical protein
VPTLGIFAQFIVQFATVHTGIQALVMTSQIKLALQAQATPKAVATELFTAVVPHVTHVFVMSFHTDDGAVAVLQLQLKLPMIALEVQAKHLASGRTMLPVAQEHRSPIHLKLMSTQEHALALIFLRA